MFLLGGRSYEGRLRTLEWSSWEKMKLRRALIASHSSLRRGSGEGGTDLFSLVTTARTCGNGTTQHQGTAAVHTGHQEKLLDHECGQTLQQAFL